MIVSRIPARAAALTAIGALLATCGNPTTDAERWSRDWSPPTSDVARALARANVIGCAEMYQKESTEGRGEFAAACSQMPDGSGRQAWVGYQVFLYSGQVLGPDLTAVYTKFGGPPRDLSEDDGR